MKLTWRLSFSTFRMDRKQVQCLDCGKKLSSRDRLKQHMATQHSDNPPTFTCQCGKVFKSQRGLTSHEMLHTGGIKCGLCPFEGTHGEQMRAHRRSQHGADRLQCTQCDTTFTHRSSLTQHIASVHSNTHIACMQCGQLCAESKGPGRTSTWGAWR